MKSYFSDTDDEACYTLDYFKEQLCADVPEMKLYIAEIEYGTEYFWCSEFGEVGETGESCGKLCDKYSPRNGKNGRCRFHKNCYTPSDKLITIKLSKKELSRLIENRKI